MYGTDKIFLLLVDCYLHLCTCLVIILCSQDLPFQVDHVIYMCLYLFHKKFLLSIPLFIHSNTFNMSHFTANHVIYMCVRFVVILCCQDTTSFSARMEHRQLTYRDWKKIDIRRYICLSLNRILSGILNLVVQSYDCGWYGHTAFFIVPQGKNFNISWSPHHVGTLNSMAFLLLLFFVLAYSTKATLRGIVVLKLWRKERQEIKFRNPYPPKAFS